MYNGPIYNRRGQKIGELRNSALADPFSCLIVALLPIALVFTIIAFIVHGAILAVNSIFPDRASQVNQSIVGGADHDFSESHTTGNVVVNEYGYLLSNDGASATFDINATVAGSYKLNVYEAPADATTDTVEVSVNGGPPTTMHLLFDTGQDDPAATVVVNASIAISLQAGENTITFSHQTRDDCNPHLDPDHMTEYGNICTFLTRISLS